MNSVEIKVEAKDKEASQFIPDWLQDTIVRQMEEIDDEIRHHEEAIKELNKLYVAHANFLEKYSPFEQRNLSQECSLDKLISPGVLPQAEGREECDGRADSDT